MHTLKKMLESSWTTSASLSSSKDKIKRWTDKSKRKNNMYLPFTYWKVIIGEQYQILKLVIPNIFFNLCDNSFIIQRLQEFGFFLLWEKRKDQVIALRSDLPSSPFINSILLPFSFFTPKYKFFSTCCSWAARTVEMMKLGHL